MTEKTRGRGRPKKEVFYRLASIDEIPRIVEFTKRIPKDNQIDDWAPTDIEYTKNSLYNGLMNQEGMIFLAVTKKSKYTKKTKNQETKRSSGRSVHSDTMKAKPDSSRSDSIVGVLIMARGSVWWSTKEFYTNVVFYVDPVFRKRGVSENLLFLAKTFSKDLGVPFVIEIATEKNLKLFDRYFAMKGFKKVGARYACVPEDTKDTKKT